MSAQIGNMLKGETLESAIYNGGDPYAHVALPNLSLMKGLGLKCERYEKQKGEKKKKKEIEIWQYSHRIISLYQSASYTEEGTKRKGFLLL